MQWFAIEVQSIRDNDDFSIGREANQNAESASTSFFFLAIAIDFQSTDFASEIVQRSILFYR